MRHPSLGLREEGRRAQRRKRYPVTPGTWQGPVWHPAARLMGTPPVRRPRAGCKAAPKGKKGSVKKDEIRSACFRVSHSPSAPVLPAPGRPVPGGDGAHFLQCAGQVHGAYRLPDPAGPVLLRRLWAAGRARSARRRSGYKIKQGR